MTKGPVFTWQYCNVCGRKIAKKKGVSADLGLLCGDPVCEYQGVPAENLERDSFVVSGILAGVGVSQIAFSTRMSRQRVYQIFDKWKKGV